MNGRKSSGTRVDLEGSPSEPISPLVRPIRSVSALPKPPPEPDFSRHRIFVRVVGAPEASQNAQVLEPATQSPKALGNSFRLNTSTA